MPNTRPYQHEDREPAIAAFGDARAIDQPTHHIHVAEAGAGEGVALWVEPGPGGEPYLGAVITERDDRRLFYQLVAACARDMLDRGYTHGSFTVHDRRLLSLIERDFHVDPAPAGRDPRSGETVRWEIRVELEDALEQLRGVLDG